MKIFSAPQIRACDEATTRTLKISSLTLMERAAQSCCRYIESHYKNDQAFVILCGTGNNGGDGLALTRQLHQKGFPAKACLIQFNEKPSGDNAAHFFRLQSVNPALVEIIKPESFISEIPEEVILIDAILGTGLSRPVEGWLKTFFQHINRLPNHKISIDIPSGLPSDEMIRPGRAVIRADETLSFQFYKRTFLHPETGIFTGKVHIMDIGLDRNFIERTPSPFRVVDASVARQVFRPRNPFSHKGNYGSAFLAGGSKGFMGAICLSARAASRAGAGKVTGIIPGCGYNIFQSTVPEAMCITAGTDELNEISGWEKADAIGIGPGMGTSGPAGKALKQFLYNTTIPLVIDADALNMIGGDNGLLKKIPPGSILTPHPKEFERLFGPSPDSMQRLELARSQAMRHNLVIVLKDRHTVTVTPEGLCWYNITGNAGLATGGSGDVLTGILTAFLAQKYPPVQAAMLGVYLHGLAADSALQSQSMESMIPGDIIRKLGQAFKALG